MVNCQIIKDASKLAEIAKGKIEIIVFEPGAELWEESDLGRLVKERTSQVRKVRYTINVIQQVHLFDIPEETESTYLETQHESFRRPVNQILLPAEVASPRNSLADTDDSARYTEAEIEQKKDELIVYLRNENAKLEEEIRKNRAAVKSLSSPTNTSQSEIKTKSKLNFTIWHLVTIVASAIFMGYMIGAR